MTRPRRFRPRVLPPQPRPCCLPRRHAMTPDELEHEACEANRAGWGR